MPEIFLAVDGMMAMLLHSRWFVVKLPSETLTSILIAVVLRQRSPQAKRPRRAASV